MHQPQSDESVEFPASERLIGKRVVSPAKSSVDLRPRRDGNPRASTGIHLKLSLVSMCLVSVCLGFSCAEVQSAEQTKPNVLFIICDDLNDYIGAYGGHPQARTPNIDRLSASGVTFTQAHCNIPICSPSRASLFTGIYPHTSRFFGFDEWDQNPVLPHSRTLMAHFRENGYRVLGTGKIMHNRDRGEWTEVGYSADYGPFVTNADGKDVSHPDVPRPFALDFGEIDGSFGPLRNLDGSGLTWTTGGYGKRRPLRYASDSDRDPTGDELNAEWVITRLQRMNAAATSEPFFIGLGFMRPHTPLIVPKRFFDLFPLESIQVPDIKADDLADTFKSSVLPLTDDRGHKMHDSLLASFGGDRDLALRKFIQAYLASIASVDELVGKVLDALDQTKFKDNTIVVFTSDHGWQMGQKAYLYKNSLWQESTQVPCIIRAPGISQAGQSCATPVSLIDLYPTLVDLCGLPTDIRKNSNGRLLEGHSLQPLLREPKAGTWTGPDAALTALYKWAKAYDPAQQSYSLRSADWRYIRYENGREELYRASNDPKEWTNLALDTAYADQLARMRSQLLARIATQPPTGATPPTGTTPPAADTVTAAEAWKDTYFKRHPDADSNKDGTLSWPEYKAHKAKAGAK